MSNQADFEKISSCVIAPMKRHWNADFDTETIDDFVKDLKKYSVEQLTESMSEVRQNSKRKPTVAHIIEAIRNNAPKRSGAVASDWHTNFLAEQEAKDRRAVASAVKYAQEYTHENLKNINDYDKKRIIGFLEEAAYFQAQILAGARNCGWSCKMALGESERGEWFVKMCKAGAASGFISVDVPWKWLEPKQNPA